MIGNDLIDLDAARLESNIWRKGWQEKLFTADERQYIMNAEDSEIAIWLLWSMKEAAYKAWNRQTGIRAFIPKRLECSVEEISGLQASGIVVLDCNIYFTKTTIRKEVLHTIAAENQNNLNDIREVAPELIEKGTDNLPFLNDGERYLPASKSHHGSGVRAIVFAAKL